jgi:hypothetical protein
MVDDVSCWQEEQSGHGIRTGTGSLKLSGVEARPFNKCDLCSNLTYANTLCQLLEPTLRLLN